MADTFDLRTRFGRMQAVGRAVLCAECTLPARARALVMAIAFVAHERADSTVSTLARMTSTSRRCAQKHLRALTEACGEDPRPFIRDVVDGRRSVNDWRQSLGRHGGLRNA